MRGNDDFKTKWLLECAIEITMQDKCSGKTLGAVCMFCKTFGKDEPSDSSNQKRKRSESIQLFKKPWRADKMKEHNKRMRAERWSLYQGLSQMEKRAYFIDNNPTPSLNSMLSTFTCQVKKNTVFLDKSIVEVVLDDLLFVSSEDCNGEENVANTQLSNISDIFELVEEEDSDSNGHELYKATISNVYQYEHVIRMVGNGLSFRQTANKIQDCRQISNNSKFGCINHQKVSRLVRIFCGTALQSLKQALMCAWSFSIALDGGNKAVTPYLDVRV